MAAADWTGVTFWVTGAALLATALATGLSALLTGAAAPAVP